MSDVVSVVEFNRYKVPVYNVSLNAYPVPVNFINLNSDDVCINKLTIPGLRGFDKDTMLYVEYLIKACTPTTINGISICCVTIVQELSELLDRLGKNAKYVILPKMVFNMLQHITMKNCDRLKFIALGRYETIETTNGNDICDVFSFIR